MAFVPKLTERSSGVLYALREENCTCKAERVQEMGFLTPLPAEAGL